MQAALAAADATLLLSIPRQVPKPAVLRKLSRLQPALEEVEAVAEGLQERGKRRLNREQRQAVAAVLCGAAGVVPFALFGPPGKASTTHFPLQQGLGGTLQQWQRLPFYEIWVARELLQGRARP